MRKYQVLHVETKTTKANLQPCLVARAQSWSELQLSQSLVATGDLQHAEGVTAAVCPPTWSHTRSSRAAQEEVEILKRVALLYRDSANRLACSCDLAQTRICTSGICQLKQHVEAQAHLTLSLAIIMVSTEPPPLTSFMHTVKHHYKWQDHDTDVEVPAHEPCLHYSCLR